MSDLTDFMKDDVRRMFSTKKSSRLTSVRVTANAAIGGRVRHELSHLLKSSTVFLLGGSEKISSWRCSNFLI